MIDIKSLNEDELKNEMRSIGEPAFRAGQIFSWLHVKRVNSFDEMTDLSKSLRNKLAERYEITALAAVRSLKSSDGTVKFLYKLSDGQVIESVLMTYKHGHSICVSSQVGCRMGCAFCASTIDGLVRNLTASEILEQVYEAERSCEVTISNIVIMGSGEPMDNYDNVIRFIRLVSDKKGKNISVRNITLSTCGIVPGIMKLADEGLPVTLALSLHAPDDEIRKTFMPVAKAFSIEEILKACDHYFEKTSRRVTFEYSMIDGVNDSPACAEKLSKLAGGRNCHVNLIPINKIKERSFVRSGEDNISKFKNILEKNRINVTIRRSMGTDIDAACGQLRRSFMEGDT
ncbi:MAG: 23S rRNA (adenine(2503)-C(2))-methyltransferase RlmN [Lachnospiraceae bacterium]|nr:23S rRNA (adenine(2503)-C(2))-methyltransferase RlmN [Lachnospiraceae bacterium]